mgnify:CR=1 FL=1
MKNDFEEIENYVKEIIQICKENRNHSSFTIRRQVALNWSNQTLELLKEVKKLKKKMKELEN